MLHQHWYRACQIMRTTPRASSTPTTRRRPGSASRPASRRQSRSQRGVRQKKTVLGSTRSSPILCSSREKRHYIWSKTKFWSREESSVSSDRPLRLLVCQVLQVRAGSPAKLARARDTCCGVFDKLTDTKLFTGMPPPPPPPTLPLFR